MSIIFLNDSCNESQKSLNFSTCLPQNVQQFAFLVDLTILPDLVFVCIRRDISSQISPSENQFHYNSLKRIVDSGLFKDDTQDLLRQKQSSLKKKKEN